MRRTSTRIDTAAPQKLYTPDRVTRIIYTPLFRYVTLFLKYTARAARRYDFFEIYARAARRYGALEIYGARSAPLRKIYYVK